jgi:type I restriction enzyme S subunit
MREPTAFITEEAARRHSRTVDAGALLLIVRGMALAHGLPVVLTDRRVAFNQDLRALAPKPSIDPRFLHYAFIGNRHRFGAHIDQAAHGTARVIDSVYDERLRFPDHAEQVALADFLDRESDRIGVLTSAALDLEGQLWEPVLSLFAERARPWPRARIHYRYEVQLGKMLDESKIDPSDVSPYLRNVNVQWDRIVLDDLKAMTFDASDRRRLALQSGDLLVCEGGEVGRAAVWQGELADCYYQKALHRIRARDDASTRYLMYCLRWMSARGDFAAHSPVATIPHLTAERIRATRIPLPPPDVQREIVELCDRTASAARQLEQASRTWRERLAEYRTALITEAVTGQFDVRRVSEAQMDERVHAAMEGEPLEAVR